MLDLQLAFYICDTSGFLRIMYLVKLALNVLRFVIPIIMIAMLVFDLIKNVINPNEKEGMKKIVNRVVAAIIVFLIPTFVGLIVTLISYTETITKDEADYTISRCYQNASLKCINAIENYLNCDDVSESDQSNCQQFRQCNNYTLGDNCLITTEFDDSNCSNLNKNNNYSQFSVSGRDFKK